MTFTSVPLQADVILGTSSVADSLGHQTLGHLDTRTTDGGVTSQPLVIPGFSVFALDNMESSLASQAGLFTSEPTGPSLMHLR